MHAFKPKTAHTIIIVVYTGCVIIIDAFLVCSPALIVIGSQAVDGCRRDPRRPGHLVGEE